jgi:RHS repeat-associated protein
MGMNYHIRVDFLSTIKYSPLELRILGEITHAEIGAAIAIELQGKPYAPIHDLSGNIAALLPLDRSQPTQIRYSAFGEELLDGPAQCPWRFSSKRVDQTGLVYYGRRFYQPSLGRWLSPDPAGFTDGMNLYCFVHNNPLTHFDEYGLLDFGQWDNPKEYQQNCQQLSLGVNQGLVNAGFGGIRLANAIGHGVAAPFHCYDFRAGRFNFSMGRSYSAINGWTHQRQNMINQRWIRGADYNHRAFQTGSVIGNFVGDWALGGALIKRAVGLVRGGFSLGRNLLTSYTKPAIQLKTISRLPLNPLQGTGYSKKVLFQMEHNLKTGQPDFHGFPKIVDNYANLAQRELIKGKDGINRLKITLNGGYKNLDGHFEWIIEADKSVNHRLFVPDY